MGNRIRLQYKSMSHSGRRLETTMFLNPFNLLARIFIKSLIRNIGLPKAFLSLLTGLSLTIMSIVRTMGPGTAINVLYVLFKAINSLSGRGMFTVTDLYNKMREISPNISILVIRAIRDCIDLDDWIKIMSLPKHLKNIYNWILLPFLASICIRPICAWLLRSIGGLVLSAFGILYNETLYSFDLLKQFADLIMDILNSIFISSSIIEDQFHSNLPHHHPTVTETSTRMVVDASPSPGGEGKGLLAILGIVMLGIITSVTVIMVAERYYPETVASIPVINTIADSVHVAYHYISSYLPSFGSSGGSGGEGGGVVAPESISRSSSGSSTSTVRGPGIILEDHRTDTLHPLTPPTSRGPTPVPVPTSPVEGFVNNWE